MMVKEDLNALIDGVVSALAIAFSGRQGEPARTGGPPRPPLKGKEALVQSFRRRLDLLGRGLTERELDVCARVIIGMTTEAIALELDLRTPTVATYRKRAYARLGISSHYEMFCLLTQ